MNKVLLILSGSMGDVILGTSMIKPLYDNGEIVDLLVPERYAELIPKTFHYNALYTYTPFGRNIKRVFKQFYLSRQLPPYDRVLFPRWDHDFEGIKRLLKWIPTYEVVYFAYNGASRKKYELEGRNMHMWGSRKILVSDVRVAHELSHHAHFLREAGYEVPPVGLKPVVSTDEVFHERNLVVISPFASQPRREWPFEYFVKLIREIVTKRSLSPSSFVFLTNSYKLNFHLSKTEQVGGARIINPHSLPELASLISKASLFIGMDSGPAIIASTCNIPTIVISCHPKTGDDWDAQSIERFGPFSDHSEVYRPEEPVSKACTATCVSDHPHCITSVGPTTVYSESKLLRNL